MLIGLFQLFPYRGIRLWRVYYLFSNLKKPSSFVLPGLGSVLRGVLAKIRGCIASIHTGNLPRNLQ